MWQEGHRDVRRSASVVAWRTGAAARPRAQLRRHQRVIVKIETGKKGQNIRFIVTDIKTESSEYMYTMAYCGRGRCEQMIRELKEGMNVTVLRKTVRLHFQSGHE